MSHWSRPFWRLAREMKKELQFRHIYRKYQKYTMIGPKSYAGNLHLAAKVAGVSGSIVECGTWRGGMIAGIADVLGDDRQYYLCDSFEGLPPAKEIDGPAALAWQADTASPGHHNNCTASVEEARCAMVLSKARNFTILKGWFEST